MRVLLLCLAAFFSFLVAASHTGYADTCPEHPTDSLAVVDTTFIASVELSSELDFLGDFSLSSNDNCHVRGEFCLWRMSNGGYEYHLIAESIDFDPDCDAADGYSTSEIVELLAGAGVHRAVELGLSPCDTATTFTTKVWAGSCVQRNGSAGTTSFASCPPATMCSRSYAVTCSGIIISNTSGTGTGPSCVTGCTSTCP